MYISLDLIHKRVSGETKEEDFHSSLFSGPAYKKLGKHHSKHHKKKS